MDGDRGRILGGIGLGLAWAVAVVWLPQRLDLPFIPAPVALPGALIPPGLVLAAMIGRAALRRARGAEDLAADRAARADTIEQTVLALAVWPFVANSLGGAVVVAMGMGFALARGLFWAGCHLSPPLRSLGFAATFFPTVLAAVWSVVAWAG